MLTTVTQAIQGSFTFLLDDHLEQQQQTLENHSKPFIDEEREASFVFLVFLNYWNV